MRRFFCLILVSSLPAWAHAEVRTGVVGGNGGVPFSYSCGDGFVLRGVFAHTGSWVDGIEAVCAVASGKFAGVTKGTNERGDTGNRYYGGSGGGATNALCNKREAAWGLKATSGMLTGHIRGVTRIELGCGSSSGNGDQLYGTRQIGGPDKPDATSSQLTCPRGTVATGIFGRAGKWLDQIGLICNDIHPAG